MMGMLINMWQSIHNVFTYNIITLYTLNIYNSTCQLYINKPGRKLAWWLLGHSEAILS